MAIESQAAQKFETPQVWLRPVLLCAVGALLLVALAIGMLQAVYYLAGSRPALSGAQQFPQPRVETGQQAQRQRLEAEQQRGSTVIIGSTGNKAWSRSRSSGDVNSGRPGMQFYARSRRRKRCLLRAPAPSG